MRFWIRTTQILVPPQDELIGGKFSRVLGQHSMLATDYVLEGATQALEKVRDGELRLDRTIEVSVTNTAERVRISVQLLDARSGTSVWTESYDRDLSTSDLSHSLYFLFSVL